MKNRVRELRRAKKLRQSDLAQDLKVSRQTIIAIENHKYSPSLDLAMKLARYFQMSVEEIFFLGE